MRERKRVLYLALGFVLLIGLLAARQASAVATGTAAVLRQTPDPQPSPQATQMSEGLQKASGEPEPTATSLLEACLATAPAEHRDALVAIADSVGQGVRLGETDRR
jgi:hypothetical protein